MVKGGRMEGGGEEDRKKQQNNDINTYVREKEQK